MIQSLVQQLQGVLSTKDSVETAKVCRAIVEEGVRTICQRLGKEAKPTTEPKPAAEPKNGEEPEKKKRSGYRRYHRRKKAE